MPLGVMLLKKKKPFLRHFTFGHHCLPALSIPTHHVSSLFFPPIHTLTLALTLSHSLSLSAILVAWLYHSISAMPPFHSSTLGSSSAMYMYALPLSCTLPFPLFPLLPLLVPFLIYHTLSPFKAPCPRFAELIPSPPCTRVLPPPSPHGASS